MLGSAGRVTRSSWPRSAVSRARSAGRSRLPSKPRRFLECGSGPEPSVADSLQRTRSVPPCARTLLDSVAVTGYRLPACEGAPGMQENQAEPESRRPTPEEHSMDYEQIRYSVEDSILTLTLARPERLNAFNAQMCRE